MIEARGIYYSYNGAPPYVLCGVDFDIKDGEYVSVVGDNGSGKSTLMRLVLKLLKPVRGSIVTTAKRIGYVPQRGGTGGSGFPISVYEMLDSYRQLLKINDKRVITESLAIAGLEACENILAQNLSGGQSQKALIARALIGQPELLILDEPSTGVDAASQQDIYRILHKLNTEKGVTIISVEHNLQAAISNSTQIYHLHGGHGHICTPAQYAEEYFQIKKPKDRGRGDAEI